MLVFLYGEDTFRSRQKLNEIQKRYEGVHEQGVNLKQIDCSDLEFLDLQAELRGQSLFREKKLLIFTNVFENVALTKSLFESKKLLEGQNDVIVFFQEGAPKPSDPLFKFLLKNSNSQEFAFLQKTSLKKWIIREFQKYHTDIGLEAVDMLATEMGNDLWRFSNEIKKLAALARSNNSLVQTSDVKEILGANMETNIFALIQDIARKNKKKALEQLALHLQKGESPLYLLSMIAFQFRNVLIIREMGRKSKLHPFVVKKTLVLAQAFTLEELKRIYQKIFEIDLGIKTGIMTPDLALQVFISQL